jgi:DUF1680 family protein
MFDQAAKYMDHYERGLYNHILASVAENDPGNTYHVPLDAFCWRPKSPAPGPTGVP